MRSQERHHLKQNDFVTTVVNLRAAVIEHRDRVMLGTAIALAVIVIAGGYFWWRGHAANEAGARYGIAMSIYEAPIAPPPTVPGTTQQVGTYPTEKARYEAALKALREVADAYPSNEIGRAARYQSGEALMALGQFADAQRAYQEVADKAGNTLYGSLAKRGVAQAELAAKQPDQAIKAFEALAADRDGPLPVDGVLMQLAGAYVAAGKKQEARTTFKRVADEFPDSVYVTEARKQLALLG
jgi:tetratricopeptide (TPR) repeat protein